MPIKPELLDELLKEYKKPEDLLGEMGLLAQLKKGLLERVLSAELTEHLGYEKHDPVGHGSGNSRNGTSGKTLKGKSGEVRIEVPRDRNGTFETQIVKKHQTRFDGFDEKIVSMYARGMTTREIQGHLEEIYGVEVSPTLISNVTDAVMEEVRAWQARALDAVYPIVYLDALYVKIRDAGHIQNRAIYVGIGVNMEGYKEVLGLWAGQNEGAKFWLQVVTELKNRGVEDIFIACVDGLKGLPEAIQSVYRKTEVQLCIVHLVRASLQYVAWKQRKEVAADLKAIYEAPTADQGWRQLEAFGEKWDASFPSISKIWRGNWDQASTFFGYPPAIRKVIYTTNMVESLNRSLRKVIKNRGSFPNEDAAIKLLFLALERISKKWTITIRDWRAALNQFTILFEERVPRATLS